MVGLLYVSAEQPDKNHLKVLKAKEGSWGQVFYFTAVSPVFCMQTWGTDLRSVTNTLSQNEFSGSCPRANQVYQRARGMTHPVCLAPSPTSNIHLAVRPRARFAHRARSDIRSLVRCKLCSKNLRSRGTKSVRVFGPPPPESVRETLPHFLKTILLSHSISKCVVTPKLLFDFGGSVFFCFLRVDTTCALSPTSVCLFPASSPHKEKIYLFFSML